MRRQIARSAEKMKGNWLTFARAMAVRFMFAGHAVLAIHTATAVTKSAQYWYLAGTIGALFVEATVTLIKNQGHEYRYFCPSIFIYTCAVVPPVWVTEIAMMRERIRQAEISESSECGKYVERGNGTVFHYSNDSIEENYHFMGTTIHIHAWMQILEQLFLLLLIMGRWMMPKGKLTHNQLSQLLLVYLGDAADMVEFFDAFNEPVVRCTEMVSYLVLSFWSLSLSQFSLVIAEKEEKKRRSISNITNLTLAVRGKERPKYLRWIPWKCTLDVTRITLSITLQDGPYLVLRMLLIFYYHLLTYTNLFFTAKNTLVIVLMMYRLLVVQTTKTGGETSELENRFCMVAGAAEMSNNNNEMSSMYYDPPWATSTVNRRNNKRGNNISAPLIARYGGGNGSASGSRYSLGIGASAMRRDDSVSSISQASRQTTLQTGNDRPKSRLLALNFLGPEHKRRPPMKKEVDAVKDVVENLNKLLEQKVDMVDETNNNDNNNSNNTNSKADGDGKDPENGTNAGSGGGTGTGTGTGNGTATGNNDNSMGKTPPRKKNKIMKHAQPKRVRSSGNMLRNVGLKWTAGSQDDGRDLPKSESEEEIILDQFETGVGRPKLFLKRAYDQRTAPDLTYIEPTLVVVDTKSAVGVASGSPIAGMSE